MTEAEKKREREIDLHFLKTIREERDELMERVKAINSLETTLIRMME